MTPSLLQHGVGGMVGSGLVGLFADFNYSGATNVNGAPVNGAFYGNSMQLAYQCAGVTVTIVFTAIGTTSIYWFVWLVAAALKDTMTITDSEHSDKSIVSAGGSVSRR